VTALADPALKGRLEHLGYTVGGSTADELAAHLQSEIDKWGPIIKAACIRIDS
jgi:tripartite-type tricarboxylate transporter receptor subunit TctC